MASMRRVAAPMTSMRRAAALWVLCAWCDGTSLRDLCVNKSFSPTLEALDDPFLAGPPRTHLRDGAAMRAAVFGKRGLEIGGPTPQAELIYEWLASCDNLAQFPDEHHARPDLVDGGDFAGNGGRVVGRTLVGDASNITAVVGYGEYDVLFASHVLEHFLDPLGALLRWDAVLAPGGVLFLLLPWKDDTFDRFRAPATLEQLAQKHVRSLAATSDAPLMVDFEQTVRAIDLTMDWGFPPGSQASDLRHRTLESPEGREMLHWHVFDFHLLQQLFECLNYDVLLMDLVAPFHQVIIGAKRGAATPGGGVSYRDWVASVKARSS